MTSPCAVLFDLDGTLVAINPAKAELEELRADVAKRALDAGVAVSGRDILGMYQDVLLSLGFNHAVSKQIRLDIDSYETRWAYHRTVPKTTRLLGELRHGVKIIGIVTSNGAACLRALFDTKKLKEEWFDFSVTRDDSPLIKPSSSPLERACDLAVERCRDLREVWFLADSDQDEQAAVEFNRRAPLRVTFARIDPSAEVSHPTPCFAGLDDFIEELLLKR